MPPYTLQHIGTGTVRFPSGAPIPSISDASVDPYAKTRMPKEHQVEGLLFWPQEKKTFPGIVLLHDYWGLNVQMKDLGNRLACEGFTVIVPNLYGRQGGMVTANAEVAQILSSRLNDADLMQDINSCCEFLNTQDHVVRNLHAVLGYGLGGTFALRFATRRKRLRAAVSCYGRLPQTAGDIKELVCPVLYHRAGADPGVTDDDVRRLESAAKEHDKRVEIRTYPDAPYGFCDEHRKDVFRRDATAAVWDASVAFLNDCVTPAR